MHKGRIVTVAAIAAVGLGLSACGGDNSAADQKPAPEPSKTSSSAPSSTTESKDSGSTGAPVDAEITKPGTKLKIGETAVVPIEYADNKGTVAITVTAIEKGSQADLAKYGEKAKGMTPYYIKYKMKNVSGADLEHARPDLDGVLASGRSTGVIISGDVEGKCETDSAPEEFTKKGATFQSCALAATTGGTEITSVEWSEMEKYEDDPIAWAK